MAMGIEAARLPWWKEPTKDRWRQDRRGRPAILAQPI